MIGSRRRLPLPNRTGALSNRRHARPRTHPAGARPAGLRCLPPVVAVSKAGRGSPPPEPFAQGSYRRCGGLVWQDHDRPSRGHGARQEASSSSRAQRLQLCRRGRLSNSAVGPPRRRRGRYRKPGPDGGLRARAAAERHGRHLDRERTQPLARHARCDQGGEGGDGAQPHAVGSRGSEWRRSTRPFDEGADPCTDQDVRLRREQRRLGDGCGA